MLLTIFAKISILDVWLSSEYTSEQWNQEYQKWHHEGVASNYGNYSNTNQENLQKIIFGRHEK